MHGNTSQAAVDPVRENPENYRNAFWIDVAETWYGAGFICFMSDQKAAGWAQKNNRVHILQEQIGYPRVISTATQVAIAESGGEWEQGAITDIQFPVQDRTPVMQALKEADCGVILISHWVAAELASFAPSYALGPTPGSLVYPQYGPPQPEFLNLAGDAAEGFIRGSVTAPLPTRRAWPSARPIWRDMPAPWAWSIPDRAMIPSISKPRSGPHGTRPISTRGKPT